MPQPTKQYKPDPAGRKGKAPASAARNQQPPQPTTARRATSNAQTPRRSKREADDDEVAEDSELTQLDAVQTTLFSPSPEQHLLDLILAAFKDDALTVDEKAERLRTIKTLFFNREYNAIFTNQDLLPVYASEYIPGRALCYRRMFMTNRHLRQVLKTGGRVVCLGAGNGSELLGVAAAMAGLERLETPPAADALVSVHIQDLSQYGSVLQALEGAVRERYAIPPARLTVETSTSDLLAPTPAQLEALTSTLSAATLTTAFFVLNELLATNKSAFVRFITLFLRSMAPGALFLVVDSAGSFSECAVGSQNYMVYHLLDNVAGLETLESSDSVWYRYPTTLAYPTKIQNMRHFVRLYRKS
ncbi:hypothetical protein HDU87_001551 [Geranomyces variabilis]|uniref:25S rRNA (Uridine(2843)-N(3))-methyltransferase n=1 Tax=Geranomyces variabilis TaxID=109894 RepID=A0AAD5XNT4_9FUNG|nr:hypothetical protein HDU87_001551 [Geranomyces variabilis]